MTIILTILRVSLSQYDDQDTVMMWRIRGVAPLPPCGRLPLPLSLADPSLKTKYLLVIYNVNFPENIAFILGQHDDQDTTRRRRIR